MQRRSAALALVITAALSLLAGGCSSDDDTPAIPSNGTGTPPVRSCADVEPIGDFGEVAVNIDETPTCLLLAETPAQRQRGLMEVTDFAGYPGMLFAFPADSAGGFWMRNTPTALSIAYVDAGGAIVSTADMDPCEDSSDCPGYPADAPYRFTVEVRQGELDTIGLVGDAQLTIVGETNPS